ncbi:hypothetical protein MLD38_029200 [Melastoma candidum]|uniref:Uncharacterized protein n=1 Tax=Melastoma candidum TaxID=119954 RepID=A0ACB9N5P1_9MYRT|nr:hypothetical protein MLD38_029200 [Melastoma candidum]
MPPTLTSREDLVGGLLLLEEIGVWGRRSLRPRGEEEAVGIRAAISGLEEWGLRRWVSLGQQGDEDVGSPDLGRNVAGWGSGELEVRGCRTAAVGCRRDAARSGMATKEASGQSLPCCRDALEAFDGDPADSTDERTWDSEKGDSPWVLVVERWGSVVAGSGAAGCAVVGDAGKLLTGRLAAAGGSRPRELVGVVGDAVSGKDGWLPSCPGGVGETRSGRLASHGQRRADLGSSTTDSVVVGEDAVVLSSECQRKWKPITAPAHQVCWDLPWSDSVRQTKSRWLLACRNLKLENLLVDKNGDLKCRGGGYWFAAGCGICSGNDGVSGVIGTVHSAFRRAVLEERPQLPVGVLDRLLVCRCGSAGLLLQWRLNC